MMRTIENMRVLNLGRFPLVVGAFLVRGAAGVPGARAAGPTILRPDRGVCYFFRIVSL